MASIDSLTNEIEGLRLDMRGLPPRSPLYQKLKNQLADAEAELDRMRGEKSTAKL